MNTKMCVGCHRELPEDDFPFKHKAKNTRQSRCRVCYSEYNRAYYKAGEKVKQIKRVRANNDVIRTQLITQLNTWKATQCCQVCGESAVECLDLHHVDPTIKEDNVSRLLYKRSSWESLVKEIKKCVIVCSNCHRKIHAGTILSPSSLVDEATLF